MTHKKCLVIVLVFIGLGVAFGLWAGADDTRDHGARQEIAALQRAIAAEGLSWQAGETSMTRLSEEERARRLGGRSSTAEEIELDADQGCEPEAEIAEAGALPSSLDWRNHNGNWITPVKDQGSCGSCWAFGTAGVLESMVKIAKNMKTDMDLSEQTLLSCSNGGNCDDGGSQIKATNYIKSTGIPREGCFPYSATDENCKPCAGWMSKTVKITSWTWYAAKTKATLESALQKGPITSFMEVYSDFYAYKSGIYQRTSSATYKGGHLVVVVGYNETGNYWICKNSWGTDWGEDGFFRIRMGNSKIGSECISMSGPRMDNHPPVLQAVPAQLVYVGKPMAFTLSATDADSDVLTFSGKNIPAGATLDAATGDFSWTPAANQPGVYSIQFAASDGFDKAYKTAVITVKMAKYKRW